MELSGKVQAWKSSLTSKSSYALWLSDIACIVFCAVAIMRTSIYFGYPPFLAFIPMLFGIAFGIVLAMAAKWLAYTAISSWKRKSL